MQQLSNNKSTAPSTLNGYIEAQAQAVTGSMYFQSTRERSQWIEQHQKEIVAAAFKRFSEDASARLRAVLPSCNVSMSL